MRYLAALVIGIVALFVVNVFADLFSMPRPWGSLIMGGVVGVTMVIVLLIWEAVKPSRHEDASAKPKMSDDERAQARAERRARLAAEAGVTLDGYDDAVEKSEDLERTVAEGRGETETGGETTSGENREGSGRPGAGKEPGPGEEPVKRSDAGTSSGLEAAAEGSAAKDSEAETSAAGPSRSDRGSDFTSGEDSAVEHAQDVEAAGRAPEDREVDDDAHDDSAQGSSLESPPAGQADVYVASADDVADAKGTENEDGDDRSRSSH